MKLRNLVAALVIFALGSSARASAQMVYLPAIGEVPEADRTLTYGWMSHVVGFTYCLDGEGHTFVNVSQSTLDRIDTEAHEEKHREQFKRYPSCKAFDAATHTLKMQVLIEAEAYAAGVCAQVANGLADPKLSLEREYAERISFWVTHLQVPPFNILPIIQAFEQCR
jgi:hypothetical protein